MLLTNLIFYITLTSNRFSRNFVNVNLLNMSKKYLNILTCIFLLIALSTWALNLSGQGFAFTSLSEPPCGETSTGAGFKKPCEMDHCSPNLPKCPLCPSFGSATPYLNQGVSDYLPPPASSSVWVSPDTLSSQGFIRSIFRPPTSIL